MPSELVSAIWKKTCDCYPVFMVLDPSVELQEAFDEKM